MYINIPVNRLENHCFVLGYIILEVFIMHILKIRMKETITYSDWETEKCVTI